MKRRLDLALLAMTAATFLAITFLHYPPMYLASDEAGNWALAESLRRGSPFADVSDCHMPTPVKGRDGHVAPKYPPGMALLMAPFISIWPQSVYLLPLLVHLLALVMFACLLRRSGLSPLWSLLLLLHPTAVLHSRTLMSNATAAGLLLLVFLLLSTGGKRAALAAGLVAGLSVAVRPPLVLACMLLGVCQLWRHRRCLLAGGWGRRLCSPPALFFFAALPGLLAYLAYNAHVYGSPLQTGYHRVGDTTLFGLEALGSCLPKYVLIGLCIYPLMFLALPFYRGRWRAEVVLIAGFYLFFYGAYGWFDAGDSWAQTAVVAPRFLLPALPFVLLAYAGVLSGLIRKHPGLQRGLLIVFAVAGLAATTYLCRRHYAAQQQQADARDVIYALTESESLLICSVEESELLQEAWGRRRVMDYRALAPDAVADEIKKGRAVYFAHLKKPGGSVFDGLARGTWRTFREDRRFGSTEFRVPVGSGELRLHRITLKKDTPQ